MAAAEGERLQKVLAHAGLGSRRTVEEMIVAGRIMVNGGPAQLGQRIDATKDIVEVDGSRWPLGADLVYYLANKPVGMVSTASDPEGRPKVVDLVEPSVRVWPVGRLDIDTEGALLLTNDGELTHRLTHPRYEISKTYLAEVRGRIKDPELRRLATGIDLEDGPTRRAEVVLKDRLGSSSLVEITLTEGRNRQVRRMFEAVGHPVIRLARVGLGPIGVGRLKPGTARKLSVEEVRALYQACGL